MNTRLSRRLVVLLLLSSPISAFAIDGVEGMKSFAITRTDTPPTIDGRIDEAVWAEATVVSDFHQSEPDFRKAPTEETVVRILYDDDYLYIGVALNDSEPDKIVANQLVQGGSLFSDDRFSVMLDTFNSKRNDYMFTVNPNGIRSEGLRESNSQFIFNWTTIWKTVSRQHEKGWSTEIAIPFKSISFDPNSDTWGINFSRSVVRKREFDLWSSNERQWWLSVKPGAILSQHRF